MVKFGRKTKRGSGGKQNNEELPPEQDDVEPESLEDRITPMPPSYSMPGAMSNYPGAEMNDAVRPITSVRRKTSSSSSKKTLPPLFIYIEAGDFQKAMERARRHPREAKTWASIKIKSSSVGDDRQPDTTKRLALHQACFKVRAIWVEFLVSVC